MNTSLLACPRCHSHLAYSESSYECPSCGNSYAEYMGIADLAGPDIQRPQSEATLIEQITAAYDQSSFEELALMRVASRRTTEQRRQHFAQYNLRMRERSALFYQMFTQRASQYYPLPTNTCAIDIGCGIGTGVLAIAPEYDQVIGLDIEMSALLVAKKLLETEGISNVTLVRGSALHLPIRSNTANFAMAINVLEHVFELDQMLAETERALAPGGVFCADSRNRFDPVFKEPHVGLRWMGFLPRKWMAPYVHYRLGVKYDHAHLFSVFELRRALRQRFGCNWQVVSPTLEPYGVQSGRAQSVVESIHSRPMLENILLPVMPTHLVVAHTPAKTG